MEKRVEKKERKRKLRGRESLGLLRVCCKRVEMDDQLLRDVFLYEGKG